MRLGLGLGLSLLTLTTGCEDVVDLDPIDMRTPIESRIRPRPISGGTLAITTDGMAVAADPDRDLIHVVDLASRSVRHTVTLEAGDEPGRVVQGSLHTVHVVLRGFGGLVSLDTESGSVLARHRLCPDPRGVAFDATDTTLHVSCADGTLLTLSESGEALGRALLEPDLRDVVIHDGRVLVSRFREASLIDTDTGTKHTISTEPEAEFAPGVAWRTVLDPRNLPAMIHQQSSKAPVPIDMAPDEGGDGGHAPPGGDGGSTPYGGSGGFCQPGISSTALTFFDRQGATVTTPLPNARLAVDVAFAPESAWIALAMPGSAEGETTMGLLPSRDQSCSFADTPIIDGQVTAVAFTGEGTLVMQSREPARLLVQTTLPNGKIEAIELTGESRFDTGHEIFHRATESGISCATCHPEGTDDGHVWVFETLGKRRTQSLDVRLADSAPFHWDGDMDDIDVLIEEVLSHRMGGKRQSAARSDSFTRWMFEQQRPPADAGLDDPALVATGRELFVSLDCGSCHNGTELGGTLTTPVRNHELQVPSLHRVSLRPPFMHDGRSVTLEAAVSDMIASTTQVLPTSDEIDALSAYMRTL